MASRMIFSVPKTGSQFGWTFAAVSLKRIARTKDENIRKFASAEYHYACQT
jgi:hypothetical protein